MRQPPATANSGDKTMDNKEMLMKIVSEISISAPDGAKFEISENKGKIVIELQPKAAANNKIDDDPPTEIDAYGDKIWRNSKGQLHREGDLPAIIYADGGQLWYKNGLMHRDNDLPAAIYANGAKYWYKNDKLHRDGNKPAVIAKTQYEYWVDGRRVMTIRHKEGIVEI